MMRSRNQRDKRLPDYVFLLAAEAVHAIGIGAALVGTLSYLVANPRRILILHALSWAIWAVYFHLLSGTSGLAVAAVSGAVCIIGAMSRERMMQYASVLALPVLWGLALVSREDGIFSIAVLAPLLAATIEVLSVRLRDNPLGFRAAAAASNICWLSYGLAIGAHASTIFGLLNLVMLTLSAYSIRRKPATT